MTPLAFSAPGFEVQTLSALAILAWLILKHFVCDFVLQTSYQAENKGYYGHTGGLIHAGLHGVGSLPLFLISPAAAGWIAALIAAEVVVHYHIDWAKQALGARAGWTPEQHAFWIAIGADQLLHYLTYLAMTVAMMTPAAV